MPDIIAMISSLQVFPDPLGNLLVSISHQRSYPEFFLLEEPDCPGKTFQFHVVATFDLIAL